jgi:nitronate monooxygenase
MSYKNELTTLLKIDFPVIMAPMFLVSNPDMVIAGMKEGIMATFPAMNCRDQKQLDQWLTEIETGKAGTKGSYGVNLIVQETNPYYRYQLDTCIKHKVPFYITSLGKPAEVIEKAHQYGGKVFCDITNLEHAQKCYELGCDGFIAVGQGAGGHAGPYPLHILIQSLKERFPDKPVIAAGGVANGKAILAMIAAGASAVSIGTRFIASNEAHVSNEYKEAIVHSGMKDITMTSKLSGTPCTIIRTPFSDKIGYEQNFIEKFLSKNKTTRRLFLGFVQQRGFHRLQEAIIPASYKTLWCAGQSVELIHDIKSCKEIIVTLKSEFEKAVKDLKSHLG